MALTSSKTDLEQKLDDCIMNALDALLRNYPASDEFNAIYQEKMFIKSNTKAFIHVTHYLFTVLNEKEVKKRFYWPIKCKTDESHFRTATVEYINHLIELGKLKMDKIKAMHVVIPGGIKFMKFLLKVVILVVNEVLLRQNASNIEVKTSVSEYICKDLIEKKEFVMEVGVELKKIVASATQETRKKTEVIDSALNTIFESVPDITEDNLQEFFENWTKINNEKFKKIQAEQSKMRELIHTFTRVCKNGQKLLQITTFEHSKYNSEEVTTSIRIIKDKMGFEEEIQGNITHVIKLIKFSIEHVVALISMSPLRDFDDIKADAAIVKDLNARIMSVSSELKSFMKKLSIDTFEPKITESVVCDPQLVHCFVGTPPVAINTKESEDLNTISLPFGRIGVGTRDISRINVSHSRLLEMSQRELQFSPKHERSILAPLNPMICKKSQNVKKRQFQINSAALFESKDTQKVNISRLESYSMVMPGANSVFSSTVLEQTVRNPTPIINENISKSRISNGASPSISISLLNETQIPKNCSVTPKQFLTPQPKRLSVLSPKIQVNDVTMSSPLKISHEHHLSKSSSPSDRIKTRPGRVSPISDTSFTLNKRELLEKTTVEKDDASPGTQEFFNKFNTLNINEEKNLFDTSETLLVNDSM